MCANGGWDSPLDPGACFSTPDDTRHSARGNGIDRVATSAIDRSAPAARNPSHSAIERAGSGGRGDRRSLA
jgi:hypothetical protein